MRWLPIALLCLLTTACATTEVGRAAESPLVGALPTSPDAPGAGAPIVKIPLRLSNVYLVKSRRPVLIDAGTLGDMADLDAALRDNGISRRQIELVILTHAHSDHAGLAADFRELGAQVMIGAGDRERARSGKNDVLNPQGFEARLLKPFIPDDFPELEADLVVDGQIDLAPWGISGTALHLPGHTAGAVAVVLSNHVAFVGDQIRGGIFGGMLFPGTAHEHYFHWDAQKNRTNLVRLLDMGVDTFYPGHGGPLARADVESIARPR